MKTPVRLGLGAAVTGVLLVAGPVTWMAVAGNAPVEASEAVEAEDLVSGSVLSDVVLPGGLPGLVKGTADVSVVSLTIRPGGEGGWHSHSGPSVVSVVSGTATVVQAKNGTCVSRDVPAGRATVERPGNVHTIRNVGTEDLVLTAFVAVPHGIDSGHDETPPAACG